MLGRNRDNSKKFEFRPRSAEDIKERASRRISEFDSLYLIPVRNFKAKEGENRIRFLPATWANAKHYGYDIYAHRNIGPDNARYFCRKKMLNDRCVLCDEQFTLHKEGAAEEAAELKAQARVISWIIDRNNESEGPMIWEMSAGQDLDIASLQANKRTGDIFLCDSPDDGYDLSFTRRGQGLKTRYGGWQFDRAATPLSDDPDQMEQWLLFVADNPIPDILKFYENAYIGKVFYPSTGPAKEEEEERPTLRGQARARVEEEEPQRDTHAEWRDLNEKPTTKKTVAEEIEDEVPFDPHNPALRGNGRNGQEQARPPRRASSKPVEDEDDDEEPPADDVHARMRERLQRRQDRREP